ncbi:hypothetical protein [Pontibacter harenae]|uniref:hypothetical protein n=1 Tax=Pontibacter harenae TaxID=2894083 RepID=UPI001E6146E7|nr:hypothetical protein [Pontibacter harenae]MCC9166652.1 hypothetical protein [Pontibacter harenae]
MLEEDTISLSEVQVLSPSSLEKLMREARSKQLDNPVAAKSAPIPIQKAPLPPPSTLLVASPISVLYNLFSNEAKQLKQLEEFRKQEQQKKEEQENRSYNKFFKDSTGYD